MQSGPSWALVLAAAVTFGGCQSGPSSDEIATSLRELLTNGPTSTMDAAVWADVQDAYNRRDSSPLWVSIGQAKAREALAVLRTAGDHGFRAADYRDEEIAGRLDTLERDRDEEAQDRVGELARLDVLVTSALLDLGRNVALGRTTPERIDRRWKARREPPDLVATLEQAAESNNLGTWLDAIRPRHSEYVALQRELKRLRAQPSHGGSPNVPEGTNLSVAARIKLVELNLERWRWLPDDLGSQHVLVNIPSYSLAARENGWTALSMRVVVGTPEHATPVLSGQMATLVFSPYWNVPKSIVEGETAPAAARDPDFLTRNNIDILRVTKTGAEEVSPASVNWDDAEEIEGLAFRQRPGANNALGHVKFLFPNPYDVYLHDTPADALFARAGRAFSHGCVRLEKPEELAAYVLRDYPEWDAARIRDAMHVGVEKPVALKDRIPVHIVYMAAWVDEAGELTFGPDVYGHDAAQSKLN